MNSTSQEYFRLTVKTVPNDIPQICIMVTMSNDNNIHLKYNVFILDIGRF